jgi:hypothetical protein
VVEDDEQCKFGPWGAYLYFLYFWGSFVHLCSAAVVVCFSGVCTCRFLLYFQYMYTFAKKNVDT